MAYSFVQAIAQPTASNHPTVSITNTSGNLLLLACVSLGNYTFTPSDTLGNTFVQVGTTAYVSSDGLLMALYAAPNCKGGANSIGVVNSNGTNVVPILAIEYSGIATTSPLLATAQNVAANGGATTVSSGATASNATVPALVFGLTYDAGNTAAITAGAGFTSRAITNNTGAAAYFAIEDLRQTAAGAQTANFTTNAGYNTYGTWVAVFNEAGGAVATHPNLMMLGVGS